MDELTEKHIPTTGMAKTIKGELLRCATRLYYDVYNNGLCNDKSYELGFIENFFDFNIDTGLLNTANDKEGYGVEFNGSEKELLK
jgi:hypothetical protein